MNGHPPLANRQEPEDSAAANVHDRGFRRGSALLARHQEQPGQRSEFPLLGRTWDLLPGVFNPTFTPVTEIFTSWLPFPRGGSFAEMGCGAGVTAVFAALQGCQQVTALDLSPTAVENTELNANRHGVSERVHALHSDLFSAIPPPERFDLLYWNSPFVEPPEGFINDTDLHHAFFDVGYQTHRRFLRDASRHLTPGGRLLLGFSDLGNLSHLNEICQELGLRHRTLDTKRRVLDDGDQVEFQLLEMLPS